MNAVIYIHATKAGLVQKVAGMSVPPTTTDSSVFILILVVHVCMDIRELSSIIRKSVHIVNYVIIV